LKAKVFLMKTDVKVLLLVQTRRYRDSLAALLASIPGLEILLGGSVLPTALDTTSSLAPNVLLYEDNPANLEQFAALETAHLTWPKMKIVLLVDSPKSGLTNRFSGVDLVLPVDTTVGELFQSISRLVGRQPSTKQLSQPDSLVIPW
jgi:hypothetical protein